MSKYPLLITHYSLHKLRKQVTVKIYLSPVPYPLSPSYAFHPVSKLGYLAGVENICFQAV